jgi:hypothetical protein
MTLQEFIDFTQYVRCFTFGKTDILPVHYDPKDRRYIVDHKYLSAELGERVVKDAQTINLALGYEMNTIEFAIQDGVPYAIDFLNPAPDFERDRITAFYFEQVVDRMARLVIDRALSGDVSNSWPRWEDMVGITAGTQESGVAGFTGAPKPKTQAAAAQSQSAPVQSAQPQTAQKSSAAKPTRAPAAPEPTVAPAFTPPPASPSKSKIK